MDGISAFKNDTQQVKQSRITDFINGLFKDEDQRTIYERLSSRDLSQDHVRFYITFGLAYITIIVFAYTHPAAPSLKDSATNFASMAMLIGFVTVFWLIAFHIYVLKEIRDSRKQKRDLQPVGLAKIVTSLSFSCFSALLLTELFLPLLVR